VQTSQSEAIDTSDVAMHIIYYSMHNRHY